MSTAVRWMLCLRGRSRLKAASECFQTKISSRTTTERRVVSSGIIFIRFNKKSNGRKAGSPKKCNCYSTNARFAIKSTETLKFWSYHCILWKYHGKYYYYTFLRLSITNSDDNERILFIFCKRRTAYWLPKVFFQQRITKFNTHTYQLPTHIVQIKRFANSKT